MERKFDPGLVARLKSAAGHDMVVGGADPPQVSVNHPGQHIGSMLAARIGRTVRR
jgi:hypothetical protein